MARRILAMLLALSLAAGLMGTAWAEDTRTAAISDNKGRQSYGTWSEPMHSFLYAGEDGTLVRVEATRDQRSTIIVEEYSENFSLLSSRTVPMELPIFGGFFAGDRYNFLVFGDTNPEESNSKEVCRVVKYSKDWVRLGEANLKGIHTTEMFKSGSCRMDEAMGYLYVRTSHEMYAAGDRTHRQANLIFNIDEASMSLVEMMDSVSTLDKGYVSHSYNQFIQIDDEGFIVTLDQGDSYPRDLVLMRYNVRTGMDSYTSYGVEGASFLHFAGDTGDSYTGCSVGGFAISSSHYLAAYNLDGQTGKQQTVRNVKLGILAKEDKERLGLGDTFTYHGTSLSLTDYPTDGTTTTSTPQLVQLDQDRFLVLWQVYDLGDITKDTLSYAFVDGEGQLIGSVRTVAGALSDCQPIEVNHEAVWYVTSDSMPVFYILGERGLRTVKVIPDEPQFADVPRGSWAYDHVQNAYRHNVVAGTGTGEDGKLLFTPDGTVTLAQFSVMLANAAYPDAVAEKATTNWYNRQVEVLEDHGIYNGMDIADQTATATRSEMAMMVYNLMLDLGEELPSQAELNAKATSIPDLGSVPSAYQTAVVTCYAMEIINGKPGIGFDGAGKITRDTMAAIYTNMANVLEAF